MVVDSMSPYQFKSDTKMGGFIVLSFLFLLCNGQEESREPRLFFWQKPHTIINYRQVSEVVTEFIPSSCIFIEPSLPPCRHVRNLQIFPSTPTSIARTRSPNIRDFESGGKHRYTNSIAVQPSETLNRVPTPPLHSRPHHIKTHSHHWAWNLFNPFNRFHNVTHTVIKTEFVTTKVQDPHTVVSFHVKGCRPSRLPFNLSECDKPEPVQEENKSIVVLAPLKFIAPLQKMPTPTYKGPGNWEEQDQTKNTDESDDEEYRANDNGESETEPDANRGTEAIDQIKSGENEESQTETSTQEISGDGI